MSSMSIAYTSEKAWLNYQVSETNTINYFSWTEIGMEKMNTAYWQLTSKLYRIIVEHWSWLYKIIGYYLENRIIYIYIIFFWCHMCPLRWAFISKLNGKYNARVIQKTTSTDTTQYRKVQQSTIKYNKVQKQSTENNTYRQQC